MRVGILAEPYVPVPPKKYGGTERIIGHLIDGLNEQGHEPVLIGAGDSEVDCELIPSVDKALWFPRFKKDRKEHAKKGKAALERTYKLIDKIKDDVDILHSHGIDMLKFRKFPNVTTLHNAIQLDRIPYYLRRSALPYICISENMARVLPSMNVAGVVYNGLDPSKFPFIQKPEDYVVFIGRFDREKNPHKAIQLAIALNRPIKLAGKIDHLGDGYFEEEIEPHLDHPLVEYLGEIGFEDKVELLSNATCNFHPTGFREPFGLTVLEAAYCGTPTLAIAKGAMPELIKNNQTGVLVEDFEEGFEAFSRILEIDRNTTSAHARKTFNYQSMAKGYVSVYKKVIERYRSKKPLGRFRRQFASSGAPLKKTSAVHR